MVHANHSPAFKLQNVSLKTSDLSRVPSGLSRVTSLNSSSSSSSSTSSSALSFSGGAAAGWVIQIPNGGPTIYHTGDTNIGGDMSFVDVIYKPTHVLLPMG